MKITLKNLVFVLMMLVLLAIVFTGCAQMPYYGAPSGYGYPHPPQQQQPYQQEYPQQLGYQYSQPQPEEAGYVQTTPQPQEEVSGDGYVIRKVRITGEKLRAEAVRDLINVYLSNVKVLTNHVDNKDSLVVEGPQGRQTVLVTKDDLWEIRSLIAVPNKGNLKARFPGLTNAINLAVGPSKKAGQTSGSAPIQQQQSAMQPASHPTRVDIIHTNDPQAARPCCPASCILNGRAVVIIFNNCADTALLQLATKRAVALSRIAYQYPHGQSWGHLHTPEAPTGPMPQ